MSCKAEEYYKSMRFFVLFVISRKRNPEVSVQTIADYFAAQLYGCKFCFEKFKFVYKMYEIN